MVMPMKNTSTSVFDSSRIYLTAAVIPAKAGIQAIINIPRSGATAKHGFVRYAEICEKLDSGLRRNDGVAGSSCCLQLHYQGRSPIDLVNPNENSIGMRAYTAPI